MRSRIRAAYRRWRVRRRRRKLLSAYATVGRIRHDLGPGLSPSMYAYNRVQSEGLADIVTDSDEEAAHLVWHWPEQAAGGDQ